MRSVADDLRRELRDYIRSLTPVQRIALLENIRERDLAFFMAGQKVSRGEAIRHIRATRREGRRPSRCMEE
jgi:hypothetical protein